MDEIEMKNIEVSQGIDWTKQNPEMNEHDRIFCDTLYRALRLKKKDEIEGQEINKQEEKQA